MRQRRDLSAERKAGFSATVSARALMSALAILASFAHRRASRGAQALGAAALHVLDVQDSGREHRAGQGGAPGLYLGVELPPPFKVGAARGQGARPDDRHASQLRQQVDGVHLNPVSAGRSYLARCRVARRALATGTTPEIKPF
jgi:hypothetical protein